MRSNSPSVKVLVGSRNPVKLAAVSHAFTEFCSAVEVEGLDVTSGVSPQPIGEETFSGAANRVTALLRLNAEQDLSAAYCVGLEGGIARFYGRWFAFGAVCIASEPARVAFGASPWFELPPDVIPELLDGVELGCVVDRLSGDRNSKQKGGAIAYLTQGRLDRRALYVQGLAVALVPFLNPGLYFGS